MRKPSLRSANDKHVTRCSTSAFLQGAKHNGASVTSHRASPSHWHLSFFLSSNVYSVNNIYIYAANNQNVRLGIYIFINKNDLLAADSLIFWSYAHRRSTVSPRIHSHLLASIMFHFLCLHYCWSEDSIVTKMRSEPGQHQCNIL